ncbi:MAG: Hsp20/alpha crystallin family protein, partial [bacterium]
STQRPLFSLSDRHWNPPTDIYETDAEVVIKMEVAGVRKEELSVSVEADLLIIRGKRDEPPPAKKRNYHLMEIHYGPFERVFRISDRLLVEKIKARYKEGFLLIGIPKSNDVKQVPVSITVNI